MNDDFSAEAVSVLQKTFPKAQPKIGIILGSGWAGLRDHVQDQQQISYAELAGFPQPSVKGHSADLILGKIGKHEIVLLTGRSHCYETGHARAMVTPVRTLQKWGCDILVQTNAAGSLQAHMQPGCLMALNDHINFPQLSPLTGEKGSEFFVGMMNAYDQDLREAAIQSAVRQGQVLHQGVYGWYAGPQFETPAEIRTLAILGCDAVGMSTVPETILARHAGMKVMAFSLMTNMAAGMTSEQLSHEHTLNQAKAASERSGSLLAKIIEDIEL